MSQDTPFTSTVLGHVIILYKVPNLGPHCMSQSGKLPNKISSYFSGPNLSKYIRGGHSSGPNLFMYNRGGHSFMKYYSSPTAAKCLSRLTASQESEKPGRLLLERSCFHVNTLLFFLYRSILDKGK